MLCQQLGMGAWPGGFTKALWCEECHCSKVSSASLWGFWYGAAVCTTQEVHALALSLKLGTSLQQAGCPSPQPAWGPPSLLPTSPSLGRAVKLPAASKAYCSAVTRNGCRSTGRGKARARKGEGRGGLGRSLPTGTPLHRLGRPA